MTTAHSNRLPRAAIALVTSLAIASPLAAQRTLVGIDVNAASETNVERAPFLFASAGVAPRGRIGVSVHGMASRIESEVRADEAGTLKELTSSGYRTTGSVFYGVTSRLTIGAYLSDVQRVRTTPREEVIVDPHLGGIPTRQGTRTPIGSAEAGAYARVGLWSSATGAMRVAASAVIDDAADQSIATTVGFAAQRRAGRLTLHVVPSLRIYEGVSGGGERSPAALGRVGTAASFAATRRLGLSAELLQEGFDQGTTDAALGARWRFGRIALDVGVRRMIAHDTIVRNASRQSAVLATHVVF